MPRTLSATLLLMLCSASTAAAPLTQWKYHDQDLSLNLRARTPEQITAFYTARKFPADMVKRLSDLCFITTRVTNNSGDVLWLDLDQWRFGNRDGELKRHDRLWLAGEMDKIDAPAASRAILRWTLLPEQLDFKPEEQEGGNILLPRSTEPFSVHAVFARGQQRDGPAIRISIDNLRCAENKQ